MYRSVPPWPYRQGDRLDSVKVSSPRGLSQPRSLPPTLPCTLLPRSQVAGAKKVQQELSRPGITERFLSAEDAVRLRDVYAGQWGLDDLDDAETARVVADAVARPGGYVLKPQREGGGNNLYGDELRAKLVAGGRSLAQFILMERIQPPEHDVVLVRRGQARSAQALSELGVYSVRVAVGGKIVLDKPAGHLLRTKLASSDEGGVNAGYAVLDSPWLT